MPEYKQGDVTVKVDYELPDQSGKLTPEGQARVVKARRGLGVVGDSTAAAMEATPEFQAPKGITPATVRECCGRAEAVDLTIANIEASLAMFKQGNLLLDSEAYEVLRKLNDQVKAQAKFDQSLRVKFQSLLDYFAKKGPGPAQEP